MTSVVTLRTGAEVPEPLVKVTLIALGRLLDSDPIALYEAWELARDPAHVPFGKTGDVLRELSLTDGSGRMYGTVRDVILAAVKIDGLDIRISDPAGGAS